MMNRAWTRRHALMAGGKEELGRACCMAICLDTGIIPVSAHRQHVGATITALISEVNSNLRAHVGKDSSLPPTPNVLPSASRGTRRRTLLSPTLFPGQGPFQSGLSSRTSGKTLQ